MSTTATDFNDRLLTPQETAEFFGTTVEALAYNRHVGRGLPYVKVSAQRIRYRLSDLRAYLDEHTVRPGKKG